MDSSITSYLSSLNIAGCFVTFIAISFVYYCYFIFEKWEAAFGERVCRVSDSCPSNKAPPKIGSFDQAQSTIVKRSEGHSAFSTCELITDVKTQQKNWRENAIVRDRAKAMPFMGIMGEEPAEKLHMDHVYIKYIDLLWGYIFIGPCSHLLMLKGTFILKLRICLIKRGLWRYKKCDDVERLVGTLCLEGSQVIHYFAKTKDNSKLGNIAGFFFADFPYIDNDLNYKIADLFAVDIDLNTKRFVKAKLDNVDLTADDALILLWFNAISAQHVKVHAMANWGVNCHPSIKSTNPFLYQNSVVTTIYNFFGYSGFSGYFKTWEKQGFLTDGWFEQQSFIKCCNHGIDHGIGQHGNIIDLVPHSRFVNFIVRLRATFMDQFAKHKTDFPGIDGEALFVGTIIHSLDHTFQEWNLTDPLWLNIDNPKFGKMAELGRIVRIGFVEDVPFLYFNKRFKGSNHPFYKTVYEKAAKIDKELADVMDTCIIK